MATIRLTRYGAVCRGGCTYRNQKPWLLDLLHLVYDLTRIDRLTVNPENTKYRRIPFNAPLDDTMAHAEVHFGRDECLNFFGYLKETILGERPEGLKTEETSLDTVLACFIDGKAS